MSKSEIIDVRIHAFFHARSVLRIDLQKIVELITSRKDMLKEYFLLEISDDGLVESLPLLLKGYIPNLDKLPLFLMRIGPQVSGSFSRSTRIQNHDNRHRSIGAQRLNASKVSCGN